MNYRITTRITTFTLTLLLVSGLATLTPAYANTEHDEEENDHATMTHDSEETEKIEKMKTLVGLLTQLVELLQQQAGVEHDSEEGDHYDSDASAADHDELAVWIELHSNQTHAHVKEPNKEEDSFILEDIHYTDEDEVISAIAAKTGLSKHDIEEVIVFPTGEVNEHGDSAHEDEHGDDDDDLAGIHIMGDGTVMLGNGEEVHDATITADGMIMLSDGTLVEPKFDLR